MPFTYSGDPASSPKDAVRFEMQDINAAAPLVLDAEVAYAILQEGGIAPTSGYTQADIFSAAARCCEALVRRFSMQADTELGSLRLAYSKSAAGFAARAKELRAKAQGLYAPWLGGQSVSWKAAYSANTDQVQPAFRRDEWDNPHAGAASGGFQPDVWRLP